MLTGSKTTAATAKRRSQASRREESDKQMLRAATKLIGTRGAAGTTLADVGLEAGYSRGLPIERYGSKFGLLEAVLKTMDHWFQGQLDTAIAGKEGVAALKARMASHVEGARRNPVAMAALYSIYVESLFAMPDLRPLVTDLTDRWREGFALNLRQGQQLGEIPATINCNQYAAIILGAMRGLMIEHLIGEKTANLRAVDAALSRLVEDIIESRSIAEGKGKRK
jgi:AcrR family transcriptional regulator